MKNTRVVIVSPALADANNGNWQTARRWQRMLSAHHSARIVRDWPDAQAPHDAVMIALHARRSAPAIAAWSRARGAMANAQGLAVVLTGTDLYRDMVTSADAQRSLCLASQLVVLQELAPQTLPEAARAKALVIFQSSPQRRTLQKTPRHLRALMVGHLREEKDPLTLLAAARLLGDQAGIRIDHIGAPLDAALGRAAQAAASACPHYRWLGAQPHGTTLRRIQRAHVLVHASRLEGGAHVVLEAVRSGTPVLASSVEGNVGMLGASYSGYFEAGDAVSLTRLLQTCRDTINEPDGLLVQLRQQCQQRVPLFDPATEQAALLRLVDQLLPERART